MNQMKRRNFLRVGLGSAAVLVAPKTFAAEKALDLSSKQVAALFSEFAQTKKMSPELKAWLDDPVIQKIPPYKVFDNVWYVGLRWVAAYLIKTNDGYILIDTLHPPFVGHLIDNLALLNVDPSEIKYVLMTHGHFDHATDAKPLADRYGIKIYIHEADKATLDDPQLNVSYMMGLSLIHI